MKKIWNNRIYCLVLSLSFIVLSFFGAIPISGASFILMGIGLVFLIRSIRLKIGLKSAK